MFGIATALRVLAAVAVTGVLVAGCSSAAPPPPPPAASVPPPAPVAVPPPAGAVPGPDAVGIAEAGADPAKRFVLTAGEPARCLESQGGTRAGGVTMLDGRAVLGPCRPVVGQAWSFRRAPDGTYRLSNRTRDVDLCFEGAPRVASDGAASVPCGRSDGQVWHVDTTSAGFHRLRTDTPAPRCLGVAPGGAAGGDAPEVAMVPCDPLERPPGAPRSTQDWELTPAPDLPEPPRPAPARKAPTPPRPRAPSTVTDQVLAEVNSARSAAGCGAVRRDSRLDRAAEQQAQYMSESGEMGHAGAGGSSPQERIDGAGWDGGSSGENVAEGQTSASEVMTDWMNSAGHRRNIEDCEFSSIGLARVDSMWVQTFGGG